MTKSILSLLFSLPSFFLSLFAPLQAQKELPHTGVRVQYGESPKQAFDMYLPDDVEDGVNVVLVLHGGSWLTGSQTKFARYAKQAAQYGYVGVTADYRSLYYNVTAADMVDDIANACERVKTELEGRGVTPGKLIVAGHSAGAHLGLIYAYTHYADAPIPIAFVTVVAAPADPLLHDKGTTALEALRFIAATGLSGENITAGNVDDPDLQAAIDAITPLSMVTPDVPPTIVCQGDADMVVPCKNAELLYEKLQANGVDSLFVTYENTNHFTASVSEEMQQKRLDAMFVFAERYL